MGSSVTDSISGAHLPETPFSNGEGNEGHEGHEEEDCEQGRKGPHGQGNGAPRQQGEDRRWPHSEGPDAEQVWQDCEQEEERPWQGQPLDDCLQEGTRCLEDQGLRRYQEGLAPVPEGQGVPEVSALALEQTCYK